MNSERYNNIVLLLLWFIVIIYVLAIDLKGVWTDEGMRFILLSGGQTWQHFQHTGSFGSLSDVLRAIGPAPYQPLFYVIDNFVIRYARSYSDVLLRLLNILWLMLSMQGLLRLFRRHDEWTRLFAVVIFALNGFMLMNVMQIREYPVYVTFMIWSSCILFEILETREPPSIRQQWPKLLGYGALLALLFYSHPYSIFALTAQVIMVLLHRENRPRLIRSLAVAYGTAAMLSLPWILLVLQRSTEKTGMGIWDKRAPTLALLISSLGYGFRSVIAYDAWSGRPFMQMFIVLIVLGIPTVWITARLRGEKPDPRSVYALLTMILFGCFQIGYFFLREPLSIWPRYFIAYYYGYIVLATCAFSTLRRFSKQEGNARWNTVTVGVFLFVCAAGLGQYHMYRKDPFMDTILTPECNWKRTARAILQYVRPEETVAYYHPLLPWTIGISYPLSPNALSYADVEAGQFAGKSLLWVLDSGVDADGVKRTLTTLQSARYTITKTAELGCQCKLIRMEAGYNLMIGPAQPPPADAVVVQAASVRSGSAIVDKTIYGRGLPVLRTLRSPTLAEFDIYIPAAGRYDLRVRCASEEPRPVVALLNGRKLTDQLCGLPTGGYLPTSQQWQTAGIYEFPKGHESLRLESSAPFPHISAIALVKGAGGNEIAPASGLHLSVQTTTLVREPYDLKGQHYTVSWLGKQTSFSVLNSGTATHATLEFQLATFGGPHAAVLLSAGRALGSAVVISHVFWVSGAEPAQFSVMLAPGENKFELTSKDAPSTLPDGRPVCFLLINDVRAFSETSGKP